MMAELDQLLQHLWPRVRRDHFFPELPFPAWGEGPDPAGLEIRARKMTLSPAFVEKLSAFLDPAHILEALLDHAVAHYCYCPWSFLELARIYSAIKKVIPETEGAGKATGLFVDVVADTQCVRRKKTFLPDLYRRLTGEPLLEIQRALYQRLWDRDLGVQAHREIAGQLMHLPYLDRRRWAASAERFARIIKPFLDREGEPGDGAVPLTLGCHGFRQFNRREIEKGLKELACECGAPAVFEELVQGIAGELKEVWKPGRGGPGLGPGQPVAADILFYQKLAENFPLPVKKIPLKESGDLYPHHHVPWELSRPIRDLDPWTSFGRVLPGLTQTWQRKEGETYNRREQTPDCLVVIDSSSSMPNPKVELSQAVLGAACAAEAYLKNEARVAVYNFSDAVAGGRRRLPFTRDRQAVYRELCHYLGGGTRLLTEDIEELRSGSGADLFLITDMQLANLEVLIRYFLRCPNRITAVHLGENEQVQRFTRSLGSQPQVSLYGVEKKEDLPRIVLGRVREYWNQPDDPWAPKERRSRTAFF